jgi:hypothetical protein
MDLYSFSGCGYVFGMSNPSFLGVIPKLFSAVVASAVLGGATCSAALIYQEDFNGGTAVLNGTTPDVRPGDSTAAWVAGAGFKENGTYTTTDTNGQSAWLPYAFTSGNIYEATLSVSLISATTNQSPWFALSFTNKSSGFGTGPLNGTDLSSAGATGWGLLRQNGAWKAFLGTGINNPIATSGDNYPGPFYSTGSIDATIRLALDTRGSNYVLDMYINNVQVDLNTGAGSSYTFTSNPVLTGVGFGASTSGIGTIDQFTFSTIAVPEPSSIALLALGGVVAVVGLRRMRRA